MKKTLAGLVLALAFGGLVFPLGSARASSLTATQIQAIVNLLQAFGADPSVVANVQATLNGTPTTATVQTNCLTLYNNLYLDQTDSTANGEVTKLQQFLGGRVTGYFGPATQQLVQNWQSSHIGLSSGTPDTTGYGYVGPKTRLAMGCQTSPMPSSVVPGTPAAQEPQTTNPSSNTSPAQTPNTSTAITAPTYSTPVPVTIVPGTNLSISLGQTSITTNSIYLSWNTNIPANSKVFLSPTATGAAPQVFQSTAGYSTQGFVTISTLAQNTQYSYIIEATSGTQDQKLTGVITTSAVPVPIPAITISSPTASQSDSPNTSGQSLGAFTVNVTNEAVVVQTIVLHVTSANANAQITNVILTKNGSPIGGPADESNGTITFSNVTLPSGSSRLVLTGTISSVSTGDSIYLTTNPATDWIGAHGQNTGVTATLPSGVTSLGPINISGPGSLSVATDASSPGYGIAAANTTGVTIGVAKFHPLNDSVNLQRVGLQLNSGSPQDLTQITLWSGTTQIGSAVFTGTGTHTTSTMSYPINMPKDADTTITIKADLAQIGISQPGTEGDLITVNVDTNGTNTQGVGVGSGSTIAASGSTSFSGVRLFRSYPTIMLDNLGTSGMTDGKLMRFKITATSNGSVGLEQFNFNLSASSATVSSVNLFVYTDSSYSQPMSGQLSGGQVSGTNISPDSNGNMPITATSPIQVPAGQTRYFELRGTVMANAPSGTSVVTKLLGDSSFSGMVGESGVSGNFIWSPNANGNSAISDSDWTNGYTLPGLPSSGLIQPRTN